VKTLGIIGGTGPESTVEYYQRLIAAYRSRDTRGRPPSLLINSVDNTKLLEWFAAKQYDALVDYLAAEIERLARGGADFALIAANTPHLVFDQLQQRVRIPLLSIVEATSDAAVAANLRRLALFGTRFTMRAPMYPDAFARRNLEIVVPTADEQTFIDAKYFSELFIGVILDDTRAALLEIVAAMKQRDGVDGLILGGTELSLILREPSPLACPCSTPRRSTSTRRSICCCATTEAIRSSRRGEGSFALASTRGTH
jgi:aspartate racemase